MVFVPGVSIDVDRRNFVGVDAEQATRLETKARLIYVPNDSPGVFCVRINGITTINV